MVLFFHAELPKSVGGFIGVDIFFVLSGFLISNILITEYKSANTISLKNFYIRRILRLIPAFVVVLLATNLFSLLFQRIDSQQILTESLYSFFYVSNWAAAFQWSGFDFLGHTWSLAIEEQFYLLWPAVLFLLLRSKLKLESISYIVLVAILSLICWRIYLNQIDTPYYRLYYALDTRFDSILSGSLLALLYQQEYFQVLILRKAKMIKAGAWISAAILTIFFFTISYLDRHLYNFYFVIIEIAAFIIILNSLINKSDFINKVLRNKILMFIGTISYGLYLWHYPIIRFFHQYDFSRFATAVLAIATSLAMTILSWYMIEKPILKLKRKFR
jgi:peptidoglycan/LPS O-acetylase OafA/YrhL